jgi:hypothetical protein
MLRFLTMTPEAMLEVVRIATSIEHLKKIADAIARRLDYYPVKQETMPEGVEVKKIE